MNEKTLKVLEYNKIIEMLSSHATSYDGKMLCVKLTPYDDIEIIKTNLAYTKDALSRVFRQGSVSFAGGGDLKMIITALSVSSKLSLTELLAVSSMLSAVSRVKEYSKKEETTDSLSEFFDELNPLTSLNNEIKRCIISEDTISDDASPELKNIRRRMKQVKSNIQDTLGSIITSNAGKGILQDNLVTTRNNRYCIPVKAEHQGKFPGMLHDQSQTGSTVFIEPMAVVKLNNDLASLELDEAAEITRILALLSDMCAGEKDTLKNNDAILGNLDFIFAKALLAKEMKASYPEFSKDKYIEIKKGRHPLINPKQVVPIDISLGDKYTLLVITGPNTGGKTVALKTLGLLTAMGQSGLFIPAFDNSKLTVFKEIYADIGDEQSIEQSLSTFSSHMVNTVSILKNATSDSLVLFDELGAGTDPVEGAALATSILAHLKDRNILTMATTHYSEIKLYALETDGVENACCEFNVETLRPTYRLLTGIPGKSNAFAISKRLGLSEEIIDDASERIDSTDKHFEDIIASLNKERTELEERIRELSLKEEEFKARNEKLQNDIDKLNASKEKTLENARQEAYEILSQAKEYADESIRKYNRWLKSPDFHKEMENERNALHGKLKEQAGKKQTLNNSAPKKQHKASDFKLGDQVKVHSLNLNGTVNSLPNAKGELFVQMGILRSQVHISDLELIDENVITAPGLTKTGSGKIKMSKSMTISPEVNLIGMTVDEALVVLDKYIDDAYLAHLPKVTIIHGRGTGALKNAVSNYLKRCKHVANYTLGDAGQGGYGVTVVEFKN